MKTAIKKHTLNLRDGDWDYLESMFKPNGIATAVAVRTLISTFVDKKRDEEVRQNGRVSMSMDVNLD